MSGNTPVLRRRRVLLAAATGTAALLIAAATAAVVVSTRGPDRADPHAVARAWTQAYATGSQDACEWATGEFAADLRAEGRCGSGSGESPRVQMLFAKPCDTRALAGVAAAPEAFGQPYALLGMARTSEGEWAVDSVTPLSDRQAVQPGRCESEGAA